MVHGSQKPTYLSLLWPNSKFGGSKWAVNPSVAWPCRLAKPVGIVVVTVAEVTISTDMSVVSYHVNVT